MLCFLASAAEVMAYEKPQVSVGLHLGIRDYLTGKIEGMSLNPATVAKIHLEWGKKKPSWTWIPELEIVAPMSSTEVPSTQTANSFKTLNVNNFEIWLGRKKTRIHEKHTDAFLHYGMFVSYLTYDLTDAPSPVKSGSGAGVGIFAGGGWDFRITPHAVMTLSLNANTQLLDVKRVRNVRLVGGEFFIGFGYLP